jgi:hypothetical protein
MTSNSRVSTWLLFPIALLLLITAQGSQAEPSRLSVRAAIGGGYMPINDFTEFLNDVKPGHVSRERFSSVLGFDILYDITDQHSVLLGVGNVETSVFLNSVIIYHTGNDTLGYGSDVVEYSFHAMPIGLSYEFRPWQTRERVAPLVGVGVSYFISELNFRSITVHDPFLGDHSSEGSREGNGYGIHAYAGFQSRISPRLFLFSRVRGRYADGMAFSDPPESIKVEFSGVDIVFGLGCTLW